MATERTIQGIKITCLVGVVTQLVFTWIRFLLLYIRPYRSFISTITWVFSWFIHLPLAIIATIYMPIQIYTLVRELRTDLLWYRNWFKRIYVMYISSLILYQFGNVAWQTWLKFIMKFAHESKSFLTFSAFLAVLDIAENVVGIKTNVLFIIILFRPMMPCFGELTNRSPPAVSYSRFTADGRTDGQMDVEIQEIDSRSDVEEPACCNKKVALAFAIVFNVMYLAGIATLLVYLGMYFSTRV